MLSSSHDPLRSYGWPSSSHQEPEFVLPSDLSSSPWASSLPEAWPDNSFQQKSSWPWDNNNDLLGEFFFSLSLVYFVIPFNYIHLRFSRYRINSSPYIYIKYNLFFSYQVYLYIGIKKYIYSIALSAEVLYFYF